MQIELLQELKQKLTNEADLSKIWLYYMDNFADHREFTQMGEPARNEYLDVVLQKNCEQMFGKAIKINKFLLIYIAKYQFFHGPFQVEGRIGGVIYFEDIKIGLCAVSANLATNEVKYSRFTEVINLSAPTGNELN